MDIISPQSFHATSTESRFSLNTSHKKEQNQSFEDALQETEHLEVKNGPDKKSLEEKRNTENPPSHKHDKEPAEPNDEELTEDSQSDSNLAENDGEQILDQVDLPNEQEQPELLEAEEEQETVFDRKVKQAVIDSLNSKRVNQPTVTQQANNSAPPNAEGINVPFKNGAEEMITKITELPKKKVSPTLEIKGLQDTIEQATKTLTSLDKTVGTHSAITKSMQSNNALSLLEQPENVDLLENDLFKFKGNLQLDVIKNQAKSLKESEQLTLKDNDTLRPTLDKYFKDVQGFATKRMKINLAPPVGGDLTLFISQQGNGLRAQFSTSSEDVLEWVKANLNMLKGADVNTNIRWLPPQMEMNKDGDQKQDKRDEKRKREEGSDREEKQTDDRHEVVAVKRGGAK